LKHANVALFVPNNGCPHACSFCNQHSITGQQTQPTAEDVRRAAGIALRSLGAGAGQAEIAFFGGSFTAVERGYMISLLEAAAPYVRDGKFAGIRVSTRPDAVDAETLSLLKRYGVTTIELGVQSMDDRVLARNRRGHTAEQVADASERIRSGGFSLGLQMMTGLLGDTDDGAGKTAERLAALRPDCVRIYPAIVLRGTELGNAYLRGEYRPQTLEEAVRLCAGLLDFFERNRIPVIRLGLHASPELERDMLAGPWHPAFRELCESRRFFTKVVRELRLRKISEQPVRIRVNPKDVSQATGQKKRNLRQLSRMGYPAEIVPDDTVRRGGFSIIETRG
jgi:histone acetyltransferase (RNA polymerase elongator complex component)